MAETLVDEIEVTDAMIEAGVKAMLACDPRVTTRSETVRLVYAAMREREDGYASCIPAVK